MKRYALSGTPLQDIVIRMLLLVIVGAVGQATTHVELNDAPLVRDPDVVGVGVAVLSVVVGGG